MRSLESAFQGVGDWCERTGKRGGFPTGERGPSASPYVDVYRVIELASHVVEQRVVPVTEIGIDLNYPDPNWAAWRQAFTAVNAYAHSQGFFHGFCDFSRVYSNQGVKLRVNLMREVDGVSWQDVPTTEIFPDPPPLPTFVNREGQEWMLYTNLWARNHGFMAGIPTGWYAAPGGTWVVGVVLLQSQAGTVHFVHGNEMFVEEECGLQTNPPLPWSTPSTTGSGFPPIGTAAPAPLPIDDAPFGHRLFVVANAVDYLRCLAQRTGEARIPLLAPGEGVLMVMTPRPDGRTLIFFGNHSTAGAWIVAHRLNAAMDGTAGEFAKLWLGPGSNPQFAFEVTTGVAGPGQTMAHSVGLVKQGILGVAYGVMSFAWSTFIRLSPGMNLRFVWT